MSTTPTLFIRCNCIDCHGPSFVISRLVFSSGSWPLPKLLLFPSFDAAASCARPAVDPAHFQPYTYWPLVVLTCAITQHVAVIFVFLATFVDLNEHMLDPRTLVWICVACFFVCYAIWTLLDDRRTEVDSWGKSDNQSSSNNSRKSELTICFHPKAKS